VLLDLMGAPNARFASLQSPTHAEFAVLADTESVLRSLGQLCVLLFADVLAVTCAVPVLTSSRRTPHPMFSKTPAGYLIEDDRTAFPPALRFSLLRLLVCLQMCRL
jgi:hypothetical protein